MTKYNISKTEHGFTTNFRKPHVPIFFLLSSNGTSGECIAGNDRQVGKIFWARAAVCNPYKYKILTPQTQNFNGRDAETEANKQTSRCRT